MFKIGRFYTKCCVCSSILVWCCPRGGNQNNQLTVPVTFRVMLRFSNSIELKSELELSFELQLLLNFEFKPHLKLEVEIQFRFDFEAHSELL